MTEHNHNARTMCTSNCPRFDNLRISKKELAEARRIAEMTVDELLAEMTPEQTNALRANVISDYEEESPPQVDSRVTRWLHEYGVAEYNRGREEAEGALRRSVVELRKHISEIRQQWEQDRNNLENLQNWARRHENTANERDEYASRLQIIAELCNRDLSDPIGDRVDDLDVFAQRMRTFAKEFIAREGFMGPNPERFADALIQYVTGRKSTDIPAR